MGRRGAGAKTAEILEVLIELGATHLSAEFAVSSDKAQAAMSEIAQRWAERCGGGMVYVPKGHFMKLSRRDAAVLEDLKSGNARDVGIKHGLSDGQVYAINRHDRAKRAERHRRAPPPGEGGDP